MARQGKAGQGVARLGVARQGNLSLHSRSPHVGFYRSERQNEREATLSDNDASRCHGKKGSPLLSDVNTANDTQSHTTRPSAPFGRVSSLSRLFPNTKTTPDRHNLPCTPSESCRVHITNTRAGSNPGLGRRASLAVTQPTIKLLTERYHRTGRPVLIKHGYIIGILPQEPNWP